MQMIPESVIDQVVQSLESDDTALQAGFQRLGQEQPTLLAFFLSESFSILTPAERDLLLYLGLVIFLATAQASPVTETAIGEAEERNWARMNEQKAKHFRDRLDVFFEAYPQEDLLAFVEDALTLEEEESLLTKEGREPIFIGLCTAIDVLTAS